MIQERFAHVVTTDNFDSLETILLSNLDNKFNSSSLILVNQLTQVDKSIEYYFSRIRLQIGADCGLVISDVLKETNKELHSILLSLQNQFKSYPKLKIFSTTLNLLNIINNDTFDRPNILANMIQERFTHVVTTDNFDSLETILLSHLDNKFNSSSLILMNQLTQFDKSIGNYFSRIRLQIGAECGLAISDVLKETKFQARNLRDVMKSVGDNLLEIAVNFQDSADVFDLKEDNLFSKVKTFLLDKENRLTQVLTINTMKIINAINPIHICLDDNSFKILEEMTKLSTSTFDKLNEIPTKDFVLSTSEQYSLIFSNKLMDLEEKISNNLSSFKNELMDKIKSLADKTDRSNQNLQLTQRNTRPENTDKKHFEKEDEDVEFNPKIIKKRIKNINFLVKMKSMTNISILKLK
jgi:hypothetical protein